MRLVKTMSVALLSAFAVSTVQAQESIGNLKLTGHPIKTQVTPGYVGQGGGFSFTTNLNGSPTYTFSEYIAFCIDPTRTFAFNTNYTNFKLYTFDQFVSKGLLPNEVDLNDMMYIASQVESYTNVVGPTPGNNAIQKNIWDVFTGVSDGAVTLSTNHSWGVLANGVNQTFLVKISEDPSIVTVPEPAAFALVGFGFIGLVAVARRRRLGRQG